MSIFTGIILYMMIYWLLLFFVLPFGNAPAQEVEEGLSYSAPANPRLKKKFIVTGILSTVVWIAVFLMIRFDVIDFYEIARQMTQEDYNQ